MNDLIYIDDVVGHVDVTLLTRQITRSETVTELRCIDTYLLDGVVVRQHEHVKVL